MATRRIWTTIGGTGSYVPERLVPNEEFVRHTFYSPDGQPLAKSSRETVDDFQRITGIDERRYITDDQVTSDVAWLAGQAAIEDSGIDPETLDYIIVAHNFGDVTAHGGGRSDLVPTLAARVKHMLGIRSPAAIAYDLPFGCPGWLQAVIQADYFLRSGDASTALVIGAETLSRVTDPHDRDSMIYADGAGACVLKAVESDTPTGIIAHSTRSDTVTQTELLNMGPSYNRALEQGLYLKMKGHKLYEYALRHVPRAIRDCITRAGLSLEDISKILLHQANAKMDEAILQRLYGLFNATPPDHVMPMTISSLGNSSVATLPTLLDLMRRGRIENQRLDAGQNIVFASVGAGMNINAAIYTIPA